MSVSEPFLTPSLHAGATHFPLVQTPLTQSEPDPQVLPVLHFEHTLPPQSTSLSEPFFAPSLQETLVQTLFAQ
ncbi:MAG TPA: hypothetical protein VHE30_15080 [Polyangiaceae bacterium]|nr:hypothetical protein [Polyangiaceae bacterium]